MDTTRLKYFLKKIKKFCTEILNEPKAFYRNQSVTCFLKKINMYVVVKFLILCLGCCRSSEEVETILNQHQGSHLRGDFQFPRLILAMDCKQKQFVAQTNVQQVKS